MSKARQSCSLAPDQGATYLIDRHCFFGPWTQTPAADDDQNSRLRLMSSLSCGQVAMISASSGKSLPSVRELWERLGHLQTRMERAPTDG